MMRNKEMLLVPGPTPVTDEIYEALSQENMGTYRSAFRRDF